MDYKYQIGDRMYYQKPLVLGQIKQLEIFMKEIIIPGDFNVTALMSMFGNTFPYALAIVLIEEGKTLSERFHLSCPPLEGAGGGNSPLVGAENLQPLRKNAGVGNSDFGYEPLPEIMNQIAFEIAMANDLETTIKVIEDFFVCNPTASIFQRLSGIISMLGINLIPDPRLSRGQNPKSETGLTNSASSSPEGTSPGETTSSGDTPLPNVNRISNIVSVT